MYLRHTRIKKNGRHYTYWRLVRSVRCGKKVRQETVAYLGELDERGRVAARRLADSLLGPSPQRELFDEDLPEERIELDVKRVRVERGRQFGDVWVGLRLWQALRLDRLLEELLPPGREDVSWATLAAVLAIARFCEPASELHIAEDWFRRTALGDLLGLSDDQINADRLYRALDRLLPHKEAIEAHLKDRLGTLFDLEYDLLLYDITSTYFEGEAKANPQAARGYSRDHRPDCKQVCIGLVVTRDGVPLGYEDFAGNRHDSTTLQEIVARMEARYGAADRIWALDRGMISEDNLNWLKQRGSRYIVGTPKRQLRRYEQQLLSGSWSQIREGLEVKTFADPEGGAETFILCRSEARQAKERAMRQRFEQRIEEGLSRIEAACRRQRMQVGVIERRVGRLLGENSRAAALFDVEVSPGENGGASLTWSRRDGRREWACQSEGCYLLRSNVNDWSGEDLWRAYIQLTDAEAAFRIHKQDLRLRPVWHQLQHRVNAHILVCFLAYALRKTLEEWSRRAGLGASLPTLLEEFARIQTTDVILPATDGRELRLRCVVRPDQAQAILLDRLGLDLPQRLRIPTAICPM